MPVWLVASSFFGFVCLVSNQNSTNSPRFVICLIYISYELREMMKNQSENKRLLIIYLIDLPHHQWLSSLFFHALLDFSFCFFLLGGGGCTTYFNIYSPLQIVFTNTRIPCALCQVWLKLNQWFYILKNWINSANFLSEKLKWAFLFFDLLFLSKEAELSLFLFSKAVCCKQCPKIWAKK